MAGITLAQAESKLTLWMAAMDKIAVGQSYNIAGRALTRANLDEVQRQVEYWDSQVKRLTRGGISVRGATITRG